MQQALDVLIPLKSGRSICYRFISTANRNTACWENMVDERGACAVVSRCDNDGEMAERAGFQVTVGG